MCRKEDRMHVVRIMANEGQSHKDIAAKLGVYHRMVKKYLKADFGTRPRKRRTSLLAPFYALLDDLLEGDPFVNLVPVYERLQRRGYTGGMTILRDYARKVRKRITKKAVRRFETEPGLQAQVDWKECGRWNIEGELVKLYAFVMSGVRPDQAASCRLTGVPVANRDTTAEISGIGVPSRLIMYTSLRSTLQGCVRDGFSPREYSPIC